MRCVSLLLLLILISCFPIQAYAGCAGGINPLYDESVMPDSDFYVSSMQQKANSGQAISLDNPATKPRLAPDERPHILPQSTGPNMSMPDPSPKPLVEPGNNSSLANSNATANQSSSQVQTEPSIKLLDVDGKWSVRFNESSDGALELILFPSTSPDRIMGSGTLAEKDAKLPLTASGYVTEKELLLTAKTVVSEYGNKIDRQFDLKMFKINETLSGTYVIKSSGKVIGTGNATATKS